VRVGPHCNTFGDRDKLRDWVRRAQPAVMKTLVFDDGFVEELKRLAPHMRVIGRLYTPHQPLDNDGKGWVRSELVPCARRHPSIDYWEGYNEVAPFAADEQRAYADIEAYRVNALADVGRRAVVGNFSTGVLSTEGILRMRPMLDAALEHESWFGTHEYSGPHMMWMAGQNQWDRAAGVPIRYDDPCESPDVRGYTTLRYRHFWPVLSDLGYGDIPLVITEGGIDDVQPRPGGQGKGWRDWQDTAWARIPGIGDYADQWHWYMLQLSYDNGKGRPLVVGAVDFGWGTEDPQWDSFNLEFEDAMRGRLLDRQCLLPLRHHIQQEPIPTPGPLPRVTDKVFVAAQVRGERSPAQFAGAAAGHPNASYHKRLAWWREIAELNGLPEEAVIHEGMAYRLPWFDPIAFVSWELPEKLEGYGDD